MTFKLDRPVYWLLVACAICVFTQPTALAEEASTIRVACLGDSITAGARVDAKSESYPARLQKILGGNFEVRNFGIGGAALIKTGRPNIWRNLDAVKKFEPHIAIISLGTNDTVGGSRKNWEQIDRFDDDYSECTRSRRKTSHAQQAVVEWKRIGPRRWRPGADDSLLARCDGSRFGLPATRDH